MSKCLVFKNRRLQYNVDSSGIWVFHNIDLSYLCLTNFVGLEIPPKSIVRGDFNCSHNRLTSFVGLPKNLHVQMNFDCSYNRLTTVLGLPVGFKLSGSFYCHDNNLTRLELPSEILTGRTIRRVIT